MVLIFSSKDDYSSNLIIQWLNYQKILTIRINGDDDSFIFNSINKNGIYFKNTINSELINLLDANAIWWRRTGISYRHFINFNDEKELIKDNIDITNLIKEKGKLNVAGFVLVTFFRLILRLSKSLNI